MIIRSRALAIIAAVTLIGGIALSMAFNWWKTESEKVPVRYTTGEFEGAFNPADIRGSYSLGDIAANFDVTVEVLAEAFVVTDTEEAAGFKLKELEEIYGELADGGEVGTDAARLFVARYLGLPYSPEESTRLPAPAVGLLSGRVDEEALDELRAISVSVGELRAVAGIVGDVTEVEEHGEDDMTVKGRTTFDDLLTWGFTKEEIERILGTEMGPRSMLIRDFLAERELEFSTYKVKFQEILDARAEE